MGQILVISSWVSRGHVGLGASLPVLQGLGHETMALPTVVLSNHPGHRHVAGASVPVAQLEAMLSALAANGWLRAVDAVLTGYVPSAGHVGFAAATIARVRTENPAVQVCCDPVLGDDPDGLYVPADVAAAVKEELVHLADFVTPNRFELAWLTGLPVRNASEARSAALALGCPLTLATSVPAAAQTLGNIAVTRDAAWLAATPLRSGVPHGTGDALAAAFLAERLEGAAVQTALAGATGRLDALITSSLGHDELQFATSRGLWLRGPAADVTPLC